MLATWIILIGKSLAYGFFALLILNACKQYLPPITTDLRISNQTTKTEVPSNNVQVDSKIGVLSSEQSGGFSYPIPKNQNSLIPRLKTNPHRVNKNKGFVLAQIRVAPNLSDNISEKLGNQTMAPFSAPGDKLNPFNKSNQFNNYDR